MRKPTPREMTYLVVLMAVVIGYLAMRGGDAFTGGGRAKDADAPFIGEAPVVDLALLERPPDDYDVNGRNLFQYGPPPRVNTPPPRVVAPPPPPREVPKRTLPPPVERPKPAPPPPPKRQPPRPDFDYLGYLGPKEDRIAVFETKGRDKSDDPMILAAAGDVVEKSFRVIEFKYETVVLGYTDAEFADQTTELQIKKR